jgi:hypothetical protein
VLGKSAKRKTTALVAVALALGVVGTVAILPRESPPGITWFGGGERRLLVMPFRTDSLRGGWSADSFAETMAVRLRSYEHVDARRQGGRDDAERDADQVIEGEVGGVEGNFMITLRIRPAQQRAATFSAIFWRATLTDSALAADLSRTVAEQLNLSGKPGTRSTQRPKGELP